MGMVAAIFRYSFRNKILVKNMELDDLEKANGRKALEVVMRAGGEVTFSEYDKLMAKEIYFAPAHWGWAGTHSGKPNGDKLCVFAACEMGLLEQTKDGYKVKSVTVISPGVSYENRPDWAKREIGAQPTKVCDSPNILLGGAAKSKNKTIIFGE